MKNPHPSISRRKFIKNTTLSVGVFTIVPRFVLGKGFVAPSDKIVLGFIGLGKQSGGLMRRFLDEENTEILAGCDVFETKRKYFEKRVVGQYEKSRNKPDYQGIKTYLDYQELIARDDIDAVVIITPDHWHAIPAIDAMKAGKDVYCEKPLSHTVKEGRLMADAVTKYNRVLQTGSMQRSWENFRKACELVRNGYVGKIKKVLVSVGDPARPYDMKAEPIPSGADWDRWCGPAPVLPYNSKVAPADVESGGWPDWRQFKETGGGILCDWGAHMFDIAQWGLGMDHTGPVKFIPPADRNAKRGLRMIYANGVEMVHEDFGRGWAVRFIGSEGSLDISRKFLDSKPESIVTAEIKDGDARLYKSENHYRDWLTAIKKRSKPICDVEIGHRSASVCNLANIAYEHGQELTWDPVKEKFVKGGKANKFRTKKYRKPYKI